MLWGLTLFILCGLTLNQLTIDLTLEDECTWRKESKGLLTTVFEDGTLVRETSLSEIREKVKSCVLTK